MPRNIFMLFAVFGGFVLELKVLIYCIDTSSWWLFVVSIICFSLLGELFNKKLYFLYEDYFRPLFAINQVAIMLIVVMKIPTSLIFKRSASDKYLKNTKYNNPDILSFLSRQNYQSWILCMILFCVEMSLWIFFVKKIGWWIWLEVLVSVVLGSYVLKEKSIRSLLASFLLFSPFFCMNFLGIICLIMYRKK